MSYYQEYREALLRAMAASTDKQKNKAMKEAKKAMIKLQQERKNEYNRNIKNADKRKQKESEF